LIILLDQKIYLTRIIDIHECAPIVKTFKFVTTLRPSIKN